MKRRATFWNLVPASTATSRDQLSMADLQLRVRATKVRLSYSSLWGTFAAALAAMVLLVLSMSQTGSGWRFEVSRFGLIWSLATGGSLFSRLGISLWFKNARLSDEEAVRAASLSVWNGVYAGAAWGSASWLLLPARGLTQEGFLLVVMSMVMIAGVGGQAVHRAVVIAFSASLTVVFSTGLLRFGDSLHVPLALGYFPFCAVLVMYARNQEAAVTTAIELSLQNEELLALRTQQEHVARQAQAEAEVAREQAERADRAKTTFIAAASHDLRQPMHALVQYVGHLRRVGHDPAAQAATLSKIDDSVAAMEDLLNAVLDFSKISMGAVKPRIEAVDVERLLTSVDTQIRPLAEAKGLIFSVKSDRGFVLSDEVLLERIVRNVAQNAVRYTEIGSVAIRAVRRGSIVRILVSDSGIGIPTPEKSRIFEEYYQVDNQARDRRKGLGLGLAIVRQLAELLDVRIRLKSVAGRGSTFALDVRSADAPPAAAAPSSPTSIDYVKGAFAVLIDDDPMARDGITTTLKDFGCRVLSVASGVEALHALTDAEFTPQVIIADYRLEGGETGLDAIAMVVENQKALCGEMFRLPALLISGDTSPQELARVAGAGYRMLHKPVSVELLYRELNAVLESAARAASPAQEP